MKNLFPFIASNVNKVPWNESIVILYCVHMHMPCGRQGVLMVSALDSGSNGPGSSPGQGHSVVFLSKALYSHRASLHPGV